MQRAAINWGRKEPRKPARLTASAQWPNGATATVTVTEMSYLGCRLSSDQPFVKGETVRLLLPGLGQVHAQIRWARNGHAGAKFLTGDSAKDARRARIGV